MKRARLCLEIETLGLNDRYGGFTGMREVDLEEPGFTYGPRRYYMHKIRTL